MSRKIMEKRFLKFLDYQETDATNKINGYSPQNSSGASVLFWTEFMMEEFELVVAEEDRFEKGANQEKVALVGKFQLSRH